MILKGVIGWRREIGEVIAKAVDFLSVMDSWNCPEIADDSTCLDLFDEDRLTKDAVKDYVNALLFVLSLEETEDAS